MNNFTVGSMFAGIGGIDIAFEQSGFEIIWANEFDAAACRTYRNNLNGDILTEGDIKKVDKNTIPHFDVLAAGFPCQPFSVAGKQRGFDDARGNLFFQIADVINAVKPEVVFLENVANLIYHDGGKTFLVIFSSLASLGYIVKYLNMPANKYSNIPQTRNRTYICAFKNLDMCNSFSFPEELPETKDIFEIINRSIKQKDVYYYNEEDSFYELLCRKAPRNDCIYRVFNGDIHPAKTDMCPTLTASMGIRKNAVPVIKDNFGYRKLTVNECLAFQGYPKWFRFPKGTTINEAYKQIGNSVCVPVVNRIAKNIYSTLLLNRIDN